MMKISKSIYNFCHFILVVVFLIGVLLTSNFIHELSHIQDYGSIPKKDVVMCILTAPSTWNNLNNPIAYFHFTPTDSTYKEESKKIDKYTETKARAIDIFFVSFILVCIWVVVYKKKDL